MYTFALQKTEENNEPSNIRNFILKYDCFAILGFSQGNQEDQIRHTAQETAQFLFAIGGGKKKKKSHRTMKITILFMEFMFLSDFTNKKPTFISPQTIFLRSCALEGNYQNVFLCHYSP